MGKVVVLRDFEYLRKAATRAGFENGKVEILLFTGVRYERFGELPQNDKVQIEPLAIGYDGIKFLPH